MALCRQVITRGLFVKQSCPTMVTLKFVLGKVETILGIKETFSPVPTTFSKGFLFKSLKVDIIWERLKTLTNFQQAESYATRAGNFKFLVTVMAQF